VRQQSTKIRRPNREPRCAVLALAHLRNGDTVTRLRPGSRSASRRPGATSREAIDLLAGTADDLHAQGVANVVNSLTGALD
jgi:hypothetical protein